MAVTSQCEDVPDADFGHVLSFDLTPVTELGAEKVGGAIASRFHYGRPILDRRPA